MCVCVFGVRGKGKGNSNADDRILPDRVVYFEGEFKYGNGLTSLGHKDYEGN